MTWRCAAGRHRDERGQVGGMEALIFGVLIFVLGILGVASTWAVVDTSFATSAAAREGARSWVESDGSPAAWRAAQGRATEAFNGSGRTSALTVDRTPTFTRCAPVTVTASTEVGLPRIPLVRTAAFHVRVRSQHTERVDPFRAGLSRRGGGCGP